MALLYQITTIIEPVVDARIIMLIINSTYYIIEHQFEKNQSIKNTFGQSYFHAVNQLPHSVVVNAPLLSPRTFRTSLFFFFFTEEAKWGHKVQ